MHIRKGDTVAVIAGKEKGRRGKVLDIVTKKDRVVVEKLMMVKRHTKPSQKAPQGGIVEKEGTIHISNIALFCEKCAKPRRAGVQFNQGGGKVRVCKTCGNEFPQLSA